MKYQIKNKDSIVIIIIKIAFISDHYQDLKGMINCFNFHFNY